MRCRVLASGSRPTPAAILSSRCCGLSVAGITQVTAGCATIHFNKNCAQEWQSNSAAHAGNGFAGNDLKNTAAPKWTINENAHAKVVGEGEDALSRARSTSE